MSQHESLRQRWEQHCVKNTLSKYDDVKCKEASGQVMNILKELYPNHGFEIKNYLYFKDIEKYCERAFNINYDYSKRKLAPDGGIIWMDDKYPILISEMKRQGTNNEREKEGKNKQAVGNAIERLGKNLIGFKNLFENDEIFPFICFCWGCDVTDKTFLGKLYTLNSFYEINIIYDKPNSYINKPFTILLKENSSFTLEELALPMLQVASEAIKYFEEKEKNNFGLFR